MSDIGSGLSSVFDPLLRMSVQASAVILVVLALRAFLTGRLSGRWLHALWIVVLVRLALPWTTQVEWSPFAFVRGFQPRAEEVAHAPEPVAEPATAWIGPFDDTADKSSVGAHSTTPVVSGRRVSSALIWHFIYSVWLAGIIGLILYVGATNWRFWRSVTGLRQLTDAKVLELLEDCRQLMGIRTPVGVIVTDRAASPALLGFLRPRLLLPPGLVEMLDRSELRHVFLHELAHLKRHDVLLGWLACLVQIVHWCNPLVWLAASRMRADRELACDALAMQVIAGEPREYGNTILRLLERFSRPQYMPALTGILEDKHQLRRRLTMISRFDSRSERRSALGLAILIAIGGIAFTEAPGQAQGQQKAPAATSPVPDVTEPFSPNKTYTITAGKGLEIIGIGDTAQQVEKVFGSAFEKDEFNRSYKLAYDKAGVDFILRKDSNKITEIHFNEGFRGNLGGGLRMGSSLEQVVSKTGGVKKRVNASPEEAQSLQMGSDRILYTQRMGREITAYELTDSKKGINYWFDADKKLVQVVVYAGQDDQQDNSGHEKLSKDDLPEGSRIDEMGNIVDRIDLPFVSDPAVLGKWESVDFVRKITDFNPYKPSGRKLFVKGMVFEEDGKANFGFSKWTRGKFIHPANKTAAEYVIKDVNGMPYLFLEWKSGDYVIRHMKPWHYVFKKLPADSPKFANARELMSGEERQPEVKLGPNSHIDEKGHIIDKTDYPFENDSDVIGTWKSVDFVDSKDQFEPGKRQCKVELFLKELVFEPDGKMGSAEQDVVAWTKGLLLKKKAHTAPAYEIVEKDGAKYMFFEWKSGDYTVLHRKPAYYVLKKVDSEK